MDDEQSMTGSVSAEGSCGGATEIGVETKVLTIFKDEILVARRLSVVQDDIPLSALFDGVEGQRHLSVFFNGL